VQQLLVQAVMVTGSRSLYTWLMHQPPQLHQLLYQQLISHASRGLSLGGQRLSLSGQRLSLGAQRPSLGGQKAHPVVQEAAATPWRSWRVSA